MRRPAAATLLVLLSCTLLAPGSAGAAAAPPRRLLANAADVRPAAPALALSWLHEPADGWPTWPLANQSEQLIHVGRSGLAQGGVGAATLPLAGQSDSVARLIVQQLLSHLAASDG